MADAIPRQAGGMFPRREFLVLGSAGVLSLCFGTGAQAQSLSTAEAVVRPMPVGYVDGSADALTLRRLPLGILRPRSAAEDGAGGFQVVPASSLAQGDTDLIGGPLRLTIHGLYPPGGVLPKKRSQMPLAIDLDVLFPSPDPLFPEPFRFFAWSFRRQPGWNPSPPVSFVYPLDWDALPELEMRVVPANGGPAMTFRTRFTFDTETGRPRLLRGAYVLGTTPNAWRSTVPLKSLGPDTPASLVSVLLSVEPEPAGPEF